MRITDQDVLDGMRQALVLASPLSDHVKSFIIGHMDSSVTAASVVSSLATLVSLRTLDPVACESIANCLELLGFENESEYWRTC